jgi:hypothetical protein
MKVENPDVESGCDDNFLDINQTHKSIQKNEASVTYSCGTFSHSKFIKIALLLFLLAMFVMCFNYFPPQNVAVIFSNKTLIYDAEITGAPIIFQKFIEDTRDTSPTVAFIINGGIRSFEFTGPTILENFVNAIQPNPARRQIFFDVSLINDCGANFVNIKNDAFLGECAELFKNYTAEFFQNAGFLENWSAPIVELNSNVGCNNEYFLTNSKCCQKNAHATDKFWGFKQYARRVVALNNVRKYMQETGRKFDLICITRPDLHFFEPVPNAAFFNKATPRLFFSGKEGDSSFGDYIYIFPISLLDNLQRSFIEVFDKNCIHNPGGNGGSPEWRIREIWEDEAHLVPCQIFQFNFAIVRSHTRADCSRLANNIWKSTNPMYVKGRDKRAISAEENCKKRFPN